MKFLPKTTIAEVSHGRDNNFNLIRMIAASSVLVSHAYPISQGFGAVQPLQVWLGGTTLGTVAVLAFFAISGFLITKSYDRTRDWRRFLKARAYRLLPALAFVLVITVFVAGAFLTTAPMWTFLPQAASYVASNLTLFKMQYPLPGVFEDNPFGPSINGSLWTLFYEVACYFGVLILGLAGLLNSRLTTSLVVVGLFVAQSVAPYVPYPDRVATMIHFALPFAFGGWVYVLRDRVPMSVPLALVAMALSLSLRGTALFDAAFAIALAYWVLLLGFARVPAMLHYNRLGDYSYGTYVFAFPVQQFLASQGVVSPVLNMTLALPITIVMAVVSWTFVEAPALGHLRRPGRASVK